MAFPESLPTLPDELLMAAFQDAAMSNPKNLITDANTPLFPATINTFRLNGDAGLNDKNGLISLPLNGIIFTIGTHYGTEIVWTAGDAVNPNGVPLAVGEITIPFTVWASSKTALEETRRRLIFARDHRRSVFGLHGLTLQGKMVPQRDRAIDPKTGLFAEDHRWHFWWERV